MFQRLKVLIPIIYSAFLIGCDQESRQEYQGYIDGDLTYVASPFSGILEQLLVNEGDEIDAKTLVAELELEPQQSQQKQALFELESAQKTLENLKKGERATVVAGIEAEIARAESELALAKVRLDRTSTLYDKKLTDKDALDEATTQYNTRVDTLKQLKSKLEEAKLGSREDVIAAQEALVQAALAKVQELDWAMASKKLSAPNQGKVVDIYYKQGEFVPSSRAILSILSPEHQYVIFFLPVAKTAQIKLSDEVWIDCEGCNKKAKAKITYISPKVEFTPPLIFSRQHHDKYIMKLHARINDQDLSHFHLGQPVYVILNEAS